MKTVEKLILSLVFLAVLVLPAAVFAEETAERVGVHISIPTNGFFKLQTLVFDLRDGETNELLDSRELDVYPSMPSADLEFSVPAYESGKSFFLHMSQGDAELEYNGNVGAYFVLEAREYPDSGLLCSDFYLTLSRAAEKAVGVSLAGELRYDVPILAEPRGLLISSAELSQVGIKSENTPDNGLRLYAGDVSLTMYMNQACAYKNAEAFNLSMEPQYANDLNYVPVADVAEAFDCAVSVYDDGAALGLSLGYSPKAQTEDEKRLNAKGLSSETPYLIWVSKSDYTVRVYTGAAGNWRRINSFACAIGASRTPTCEGVFKYYQYQTRWAYAKYYCGPIMRFNGGYAIHSTLRRYDGSDYDGRVGMKISHGCVRVRPENIEWLAETIPLNSTVYVTA